MKTTKKIVSALFAVMLIFTACKKDKALEPQKEEIVLPGKGFSSWSKEADLLLKKEITLSDAEYEKIKTAIGGIEVKYAISGKLETLPLTLNDNGTIITFYHQLTGNKLAIYKQTNELHNNFFTAHNLGEAQLGFYILK
jgi:hypothetical protein